MSKPNSVADLKMLTRAVITNQIARFAPRAYLNLTAQTGRGAEPESVSDIADYFRRCFDDYRAQLAARGLAIETLIEAQHLLEYGPGDLPGVALLMIANGAARVTCADRFPMVRLSEKNTAVLNDLLERLEPGQRERAARAFRRPGVPGSGLNPEVIDYLLSPDGCSGRHEEYRLIYSRAVLEHVNDLDATFGDMYRALLPGGLAIHQVDLKSHGLHREHRLDFLCWSDRAWNLMHSAKGVPNRWRIDKYRALIDGGGWRSLGLEARETAEAAQVDRVRDCLIERFARLPTPDLQWLSFWLLAEKPRDSAKPPPGSNRPPRGEAAGER
jgi:SAM-dependent methyltransferase